MAATKSAGAKRKASAKKKSAKKKTAKRKAPAGRKKAVKKSSSKKNVAKHAIEKIHGKRGPREKEVWHDARVAYVTASPAVTLLQLADHFDVSPESIRKKSADQNWGMQREIAQRESNQAAIDSAYDDLVAFKVDAIDTLLWIIGEAKSDVVLHVAAAKATAIEEGIPFRKDMIFGEDNARSAVYVLLRAQQQLINLTKSEADETNLEEAIIVFGDSEADEVAALAKAYPSRR